MDLYLIKAPGRGFTAEVTEEHSDGYDCHSDENYFRVWDTPQGEEPDAYTVALVDELGEGFEPQPGWSWARVEE